MESGGEAAEVIIVTRPASPEPPSPGEALLEILNSSLGLASYTASTVVSLMEQAVASAVNGALDRIVPAIADAVVARLDLTDLVIDRVDLARVVNSTLDEMDLTTLVLDRVDVNAIVDAADIEAIIDRVPIVAIADYVIDEIDLPQIIRDSTSGVAGEALDSIRRQGVGADVLVSRLFDSVIRRRERNLDAPGDPQSLAGSAQAGSSESGSAEPTADGESS
jgi:hypothetical protein